MQAATTSVAWPRACAPTPSATTSEDPPVSTAALWFLLVGVLFVVMALSGSLLRRLPLTTSLVYLGVGYGLGPAGAGLIVVDPMESSPLLERICEIAVLISLFAAGLKLRLRLSAKRWLLPLRLAGATMALTVGLIALAGLALGLELGAAILLGAILAPTDPVLASDVQVEHPRDRDRLRFTLTGEAGLNDGTAFPFVMLGLGLLGLHELGHLGWRWLAVDVLWAVVAGIALGWVLGTLVGRLVLHLRREHQEAVGLDDFLTLGLIALAYGVAIACHAYGFLAVFAAGLALRHVEMRASGDGGMGDMEDPAELLDPSVPPPTAEAATAAATDPARAPAYLARAVLGFNEQLERIVEVGVVVLVGALLATVQLPASAWWFTPLLLLVLRPLAVLVGMAGSRSTWLERGMVCWFGIRGVGSIYYLMFALSHGVAGETARVLLDLTLVTVAVSIVVHGISVTPLMERYRRLARPRG